MEKLVKKLLLSLFLSAGFLLAKELEPQIKPSSWSEEESEKETLDFEFEGNRYVLLVNNSKEFVHYKYSSMFLGVRDKSLGITSENIFAPNIFGVNKLYTLKGAKVFSLKMRHRNVICILTKIQVDTAEGASASGIIFFHGLEKKLTCLTWTYNGKNFKLINSPLVTKELKLKLDEAALIKKALRGFLWGEGH